MELHVRLARPDELEALPEIEREAGKLFQQLEATAGIPDDLSPMDELVHAQSEGHVWVATIPSVTVPSVTVPSVTVPSVTVPGEAAAERIVGFAYAARLDGNLHLEELDVLPEFGRRGIGRALVETVILAAVREDFPAVTLSTFRHVPWNGPFYAKLGFRVVPPAELTPKLAEAFLDEERRGLPIEIRVVMRLDLEGFEGSEQGNALNEAS